eukprot:NODE_3400_length_559_cov_508.150980_g2868_i0.p1 GENE.NODE_3400_length_559_cov_508.150980_g2868_i0~~NODE_3400_length_559_cov_508.150980_g2868_i0.p1  ORF type:complete len:119 (+),score=24.75 NODE_3400_length_559_cov_508.150980_g2868_i0:59-415(+)
MVKSSKTKKCEPKIYEATIHMHKHMRDTTFKQRANKAVKVVKRFTRRFMKTKDVRVEPKLNKFIWSKGIKGVPFRTRIRMDRKRNEDEDAKRKMYCVVSWVPVATYKGLRNQRKEQEE